MNSKAPTRIVFSKVDGFPRANGGLVFSLVASSVVGFAVAGSSTGLPAVFLGLLTLSSLVLSPVCAKRSGYRAAVGIAVITALASALTLVSSHVYGLLGSGGFGTALWGLLQVAVVKFAYGAIRKTRIRPIMVELDPLRAESSRFQRDRSPVNRALDAHSSFGCE